MDILELYGRVASSSDAPPTPQDGFATVSAETEAKLCAGSAWAQGPPRALFGEPVKKKFPLFFTATLFL